MVKKVTDKKDLEQIHALASYAFNSNHTEEQKEAYINKNQFVDNYVEELNGQIASQVISYPFNVTINGVAMGMSGIGDVASYPEARGTGGIRHIFEAIFNDLHEKGTELSYLAPFSQAFYRKFGYETIFDFEEIRIPASIIQQIKPEKLGSVKRTEWSNEETQTTLKALYKETLGREHGTVIRDDYWWEYTLTAKKNRRIALCYDDNNKAQGYLIYELIGATEFRIHELSYTNSFAMKKLMTFVSSHSGSFAEFVSTNLRDKMILELFTEMKGITRKTYSNMMVRIVNFKNFIEKYPFKNNGKKETVHLKISDTTCEWNDEIFEITIENGKASCEVVTTDVIVDYSGSIQRWVQVFMGHHTLEQAIWLDLIKQPSEANILGDLIEYRTPQLYDYF